MAEKKKPEPEPGYDMFHPKKKCKKCGSQWFHVTRIERPRSVVFKTHCKDCKTEVK